MNLRPARITAAVMIGLTVTLVVPTSAPGAPIDDLKSKAKSIEGQIAANGAKVAALGEQLNAAQIELDDARRQDRRRRRAHQGRRGRDHASPTAPPGARRPDLQVRGHQRPVRRDQHRGCQRHHVAEEVQPARLGSRRRDHRRTGVGEGRARRAARPRRAGPREGPGRSATSSPARRRRRTPPRRSSRSCSPRCRARSASRSARRSLAAGACGSGARRGQRAGREQRRDAAVVAAVVPSRARGARPTTVPPPSASGGAGAAVAYATAQVGKPYCYAGVGPDCYDCSGLTMMAWRQAGISMPHFSGSQGRRVPAGLARPLQPGDLVYHSSWGQHVGHLGRRRVRPRHPHGRLHRRYVPGIRPRGRRSPPRAKYTPVR